MNFVFTFSSTNVLIVTLSFEGISVLQPFKGIAPDKNLMMFYYPLLMYSR